jgi:hypothetical protein
LLSPKFVSNLRTAVRRRLAILRAIGAMANRSQARFAAGESRAQPVYEDSIFPGIPAHAAWACVAFFYKPCNPALFFLACGPAGSG